MISILMMYAMFWRHSDLKFSTWVSNYSDCLSSIITLLVMIIITLLPLFVYFQIKKFKTNYVQMNVIFEGINFRESKKDEVSAFLVYDLSHKLVNALILILMDGYMSFQAQIFSIIFLLRASLLAGYHPYESKKEGLL